MARPRSKHPPQTPAERQAKCRALKRGEQVYALDISDSLPAELRPLPGATNPNHTLAWSRKKQAALPGSTASRQALPAPPMTAIQKTLSTSDTALALPDECAPDSAAPGDALRLSLPPAVAARLRSLLARQDAGKSLTAAQRAEAQGLLDIAEYFVVQRLRRRLAA